jgi:hypothetical protein
MEPSGEMGLSTHPDDVQGEVELSERLFRGGIPFYRLRRKSQAQHSRDSDQRLWQGDDWGRDEPIVDSQFYSQAVSIRGPVE